MRMDIENSPGAAACALGGRARHSLCRSGPNWTDETGGWGENRVFCCPRHSRFTCGIAAPRPGIERAGGKRWRHAASTCAMPRSGLGAAAPLAS